MFWYNFSDNRNNKTKKNIMLNVGHKYIINFGRTLLKSSENKTPFLYLSDGNHSNIFLRPTIFQQALCMSKEWQSFSSVFRYILFHLSYACISNVCQRGSSVAICLTIHLCGEYYTPFAINFWAILLYKRFSCFFNVNFKCRVLNTFLPLFIISFISSSLQFTPKYY